MQHLKKIPRWLISTIFFILVLLFLALYVRSIDFSNMRSLSFDPLRFAVGTFLGICYLFIGAFTWRVILRALGADALPQLTVTNKVYARSWMGRYIPGTVTWIAAKVYLASTWGISKSRLSVASLLEGGSQVLAFIFVAFLLLGFDSRIDVVPSVVRYGLIGLGCLVLLVLLPSIFNRIIATALRVLKKKTAGSELRINGSAVGRAFALNICSCLLYGGASFFIVWSLAPSLSISTIGFVTGAFALATVAGMAAPFAPSGLGVKDGLQLALLTVILPADIALAATVLIRLWSILIDLIFLGITTFAGRNKIAGTTRAISS